MAAAKRYFIENVTNLENRYLVGDDHGYANEDVANKRLEELRTWNPEMTYELYVRGGRTQHN